MKIGFLVVSGAFAAAGTAATINFPDFASAQRIVLGGAAVTSETAIRLVPNQPFASGSLGFDAPLRVGQGFNSTFRFRVGESGATLGDGLAFLIQDVGPAPIGPSGGALGYYGLPRSVAIEFDLYQNVPPLTDYADPNANHAAIQSCGHAPNTPAHNTGCTLDLTASPSVDMADGAVHSVVISYAPGTLRVTLDEAPILSASLDLPTLIGLNNDSAWLSFTAATGGATAMIDITSWTATETPIPEPGSVLLFMSGLGLVAWMRRSTSRLPQ